MFVASREILATKGRFALMAGVVALITFLLVMLTALTDGLGQQNTSAVESLPADLVVLAKDGGKTSWSDSTLTQAQTDRWAAVPGATVTRLGVGHARLEHDGLAATVAAFTSDVPDDSVILPADTATALGVTTGDTIILGDKTLRVSAVEETHWYSHSPVARVSVQTFEATSHQPAATALLVTGTVDRATREAVDAEAGTASMQPADSVQALAGYRSENGSLLLIQAFLYGISALVVLAFISVWTIQRTREVAVMRALGGSRGYVLKDALAQAAALLLAGLAVGCTLGAVAVLGIGDKAPVLARATTFLYPVGGVLALGLAGSYLATRRVTRVDPLLALGGN